MVLSEAAHHLGVSPNTLRNLVNSGKVAATRRPGEPRPLLHAGGLRRLARAGSGGDQCNDHCCASVASGASPRPGANRGEVPGQDVHGRVAISTDRLLDAVFLRTSNHVDFNRNTHPFLICLAER